MELTRVLVNREIHTGEGEEGAFYQGDAALVLPSLLETYAGKAQCVYLDPPFATGKKFEMRVRVGEKDWKTSKPSLTLTAYEDNLERENYLEMMRAVLTGARALLTEDGVLFLHIDYRMSARLRLMMDEIFGEENLLNEIIWTYQSGGRSLKYFSRKHDTILFYRKNEKYYFDIHATGYPRGERRANHMKKHVDADGRVYRSIRSGGKVYTYYEDDPVYPSDVWTDISHLQQRDYQRTGYDTQKPLKLLTRILQCATRPGDLAVDLFAGSGTTLEAAWRLGRRFIGVDKGALSLHVARARLLGANVQYRMIPSEGAPEVAADGFSGVGYYHLTMRAYQPETGLLARTFSGLDALDSWAAGYLRDGAFHVMAQASRSHAQPALPAELRLPVLSGEPALRVSDVLGRSFYYRIDPSTLTM